MEILTFKFLMIEFDSPVSMALYFQVSANSEPGLDQNGKSATFCLLSYTVIHVE